MLQAHSHTCYSSAFTQVLVKRNGTRMLVDLRHGDRDDNKVERQVDGPQHNDCLLLSRRRARERVPNLAQIVGPLHARTHTRIHTGPAMSVLLMFLVTLKRIKSRTIHARIRLIMRTRRTHH